MRGLTPPSSGGAKGGFAPFAPPLMSNVRSQAMQIYLFDEDGFEVVPGALGAEECDESALLLEQSRDLVEFRSLLSLPWCSRIAHRLRASAVARLLPTTHVAVQCTSFAKSADHNWLVPVHQDLSIPVAQRRAFDLARLVGEGWDAVRSAAAHDP